MNQAHGRGRRAHIVGTGGLDDCVVTSQKTTISPTKAALKEVVPEFHHIG
jgi:hypothetical protein